MVDLPDQCKQTENSNKCWVKVLSLRGGWRKTPWWSRVLPPVVYHATFTHLECQRKLGGARFRSLFFVVLSDWLSTWEIRLWRIDLHKHPENVCATKRINTRCVQIIDTVRYPKIDDWKNYCNISFDLIDVSTPKTERKIRHARSSVWCKSFTSVFYDLVLTQFYFLI